jgi:signal transduction histidine kinase
VPPDDPDARRLVLACNRLLDKVAEAHVAQQRFVADAAHELRTPLTILRGEIQVALREPKNQPFLVETLRSSLDEAVHLSRLVDSLLTLARADAGQVLVVHEPMAVAPLVRSVLAKLDPVATEHHVRLEAEVGEGAEDAVVKGDAVALERVIRNLVENAVKHSPADHTVSVALTTTPERVRLSVTDRGIGIPPEHLPRLFDRFYRVDAARRRTEGGAGLGLAIVKTLVEAQAGTVAVQSEIGVGSTFIVELPRVAALP